MVFRAFTLLIAAISAPVSAQTPYVWSQFVDDQTVAVRAITEKQDCSKLTSSVALSQRMPNQNYPLNGNIVCEALVSLKQNKNTKVTVEGHVLPISSEAPARVLVLGDTGCRKTHSTESCDTSTWPFAALSAAAAKVEPDLIVHVGDYTYRYNCWNGIEGCKHRSQEHLHYLREWKVWHDDFFDPAEPLLATAPWVFVRGNHEDCFNRDRGWRGWSLFLAMSPQLADSASDLPSDRMNCSTNQAKLAPSRLINFSGGSAPDLTLFPIDTAQERAPTYGDLKPLSTLKNESWIVTHVPFRSINGKPYPPRDAGPLPADFRFELPKPLSMILSGHVHLFQLDQSIAGEALQIVAGSSGTRLDSAYTDMFINDKDFTFLVLDRHSNGATDLTVCKMETSQSNGQKTFTGKAVPWRAWTMTLAKPGDKPKLSKSRPGSAKVCDPQS